MKTYFCRALPEEVDCNSYYYLLEYLSENDLGIFLENEDNTELKCVTSSRYLASYKNENKMYRLYYVDLELNCFVYTVHTIDQSQI